MAYVTLVTRPSYLAGVIVLAFSLRRSNAQYPLLALYTESLGNESINVLKTEAKQNILLHPVRIDPLTPPAEQGASGGVAERFQDTYTKLRAFDPSITGEYQKCVFLDADMAAFKNPDRLFDLDVPLSHIAAGHACVCNLDQDKWAEREWTRENCAHTRLAPHDPPTRNGPGMRRTYNYFNSGVLIWAPRQEVWDNMMQMFATGENIAKYKLPDQDFLNDFFQGKWQPLQWRYNALKTMRNWHPKLWDDDEVVILHYIVDKPWEKRIASDGIAGKRGLDGETHRWWWQLYAEWESQRNIGDAENYLDRFDSHVAAPLDYETDRKQMKANIRDGLPNGAIFRERRKPVDHVNGETNGYIASGLEDRT
ncbi:MAG: hypothetical protein Q9160_006754 [Pyrenula sp. 1 TL-2023]